MRGKLASLIALNFPSIKAINKYSKVQRRISWPAEVHGGGDLRRGARFSPNHGFRFHAALKSAIACSRYPPLHGLKKRRFMKLKSNNRRFVLAAASRSFWTAMYSRDQNEKNIASVMGFISL